MSFFHRHRGLTPFLLLLPGLAWLALFFLAPLGFLGYQSLQSGTFDTGYSFDWAFSNYWDAISTYHEQFLRSFLYAGIATLLAHRDRVSARVLDRLPRGTLEERLPDPHRRPAVRHLPRADAGLAEHPLG